LSEDGIVNVPTVSPRERTAFWLSIASIAVLSLTGRLGTIAPAAFIGMWGLFFLAWPRFAAGALARTFLPWAFPLFAVTSIAWSTAPDVTARTAIEWLVISGIGIVMARSLPAARLLSAWMLALLPVVVLGFTMGGSQFTETGDVASIGIFGSKNNFALHVSEMFLLCAAVLMNARQGALPRLAALFGVAVAPLLLWRAKSIGAFAVFAPSLLLMGAIITLGQVRPNQRAILVAGGLVIGAALSAAVAPVALAAKDTMLSSVGKSADLTGRGLLWQRAAFLIQQRPTFGVGYAAFWRQGNPEAEALWRAEHIASRSGFHFHNFYYETLIELGYFGLLVGGTALGLTGIAVLVWGIGKPGTESGLFCALALFLFLRSFVELDLLGGFGLNAIIPPAAWIYATARRETKARSR
jgi:exopolysaccharide production protein ExoQ